MSEKNIITADLYDNHVTEKKGDYIVKTAITGSVRNEDLADHIAAKRTEYRRETIINIIGSFDGESTPFDRTKHKLSTSFSLGKSLRSALGNIEIHTRLAVTDTMIVKQTTFLHLPRAAIRRRNVLITKHQNAMAS